MVKQQQPPPQPARSEQLSNDPQRPLHASSPWYHTYGLHKKKQAQEPSQGSFLPAPVAPPLSKQSCSSSVQLPLPLVQALVSLFQAENNSASSAELLFTSFAGPSRHHSPKSSSRAAAFLFRARFKHPSHVQHSSARKLPEPSPSVWHYGSCHPQLLVCAPHRRFTSCHQPHKQTSEQLFCKSRPTEEQQQC